MDFRVAPTASELTWAPPRGTAGKTKTAAATYDGKRLRIQTPQCVAKLYKNTNGMALSISPGGDDIGRQFVEFLESYERVVASKAFAPEVSKTVYNGAIRLMCWDDTQWFDDAGTFLREAPDSVGSVICVLEFVGCWATAQRWGLKWRVVQVKVCSSEEDTPQFAFLDD